MEFTFDNNAEFDKLFGGEVNLESFINDSGNVKIVEGYAKFMGPVDARIVGVNLTGEEIEQLNDKIAEEFIKLNESLPEGTSSYKIPSFRVSENEYHRADKEDRILEFFLLCRGKHPETGSMVFIANTIRYYIKYNLQSCYTQGSSPKVSLINSFGESCYEPLDNVKISNGIIASLKGDHGHYDWYTYTDQMFLCPRGVDTVVGKLLGAFIGVSRKIRNIKYNNENNLKPGEAPEPIPDVNKILAPVYTYVFKGDIKPLRNLIDTVNSIMEEKKKKAGREDEYLFQEVLCLAVVTKEGYQNIESTMFDVSSSSLTAKSLEKSVANMIKSFDKEQKRLKANGQSKYTASTSAEFCIYKEGQTNTAKSNEVFEGGAVGIDFDANDMSNIGGGDDYSNIGGGDDLSDLG